MTQHKDRKQAIRARMAETGEPYTEAARKLGEEPGTLDYAAIAQNDPPVAEREWSTRARVRIRASYRAGSVSPREGCRFEPGQELEMVQWGRAGRPVDRSAWWTSTDIDGAFIVPVEHVDVLEVIRDEPPTFARAALPRGQVIAILGPGAETWDSQDILVVPSVYDLEIRAASGELLGLVERGGTGAGYDKIQVQQPVTYRAVIREDGSYHPPSVKFPAEFIPPDPVRATAGERARWGGTGTGSAAGLQVSLARVVYGPDARCDSCTCCTMDGCHRGEGSGCHWSERLGEYTCPCTSS